MGGRVIPMFTNNGVPGVKATRHPLLEKLALGGVLVLLAADVLQWPPGVVGALALVVAAVARGASLALAALADASARRSSGCCTSPTPGSCVHLVLRGLAALGLPGELLAIHALTIGAIGGMTIGMMTRTARGHTGRPLVADRFEVTCYVLVALAAAIRVFGGMLLPDAYVATVIVSGLCWSAAFALYAVRYWPVLVRPRLDGKPG